MLSYKIDFSSCTIMPGFGKSSYIIAVVTSRDSGRGHTAVSGVAQLSQYITVIVINLANL